MLDLTRLPATGPIFLDFEASSLGAGSWPIEIGLSWLDTIAPGAQPAIAATLIRPAPDWAEAEWSPASQAVHNIPRRALDTAPKAADVARTLDALAGRALLSDAPAWEQKWLRKLRDGRQPDLAVWDVDGWLAASFPGRVLDHVYEALSRIQTPHRAGPDAARVPLAISRALARIERDRP